LCVLALLIGEPKYGFHLIKELRERSDGFFDVKERTLYPALRLEERAFVRSEWLREAGVPRKYYMLTGAGVGSRVPAPSARMRRDRHTARYQAVIRREDHSRDEWLHCLYA